MLTILQNGIKISFLSSRVIPVPLLAWPFVSTHCTQFFVRSVLRQMQPIAYQMSAFQYDFGGLMTAISTVDSSQFVSRALLGADNDMMEFLHSDE